MINQPAIEWEYFIAHQLHKDIDEIRAMPNLRYLAWKVYFERIAQRKEMALNEAKGG